MPPVVSGAVAQTTLDLLHRAAVEPAQALDVGVRGSLEARLDHDFGKVRVHSGEHAAHAAERVGARAYTLGTDKHLGTDALSLGGRDRTELLVHEAVNSAQQSGAAVSPVSPVAHVVSPLVQRSIVGKYPSVDGDFDVSMVTQSNPGVRSGLLGTIKFKPNAASPDSPSIRLLQVVRVEDLAAGGEHVWSGGEANRNKMQTAGNATVSPGFFVDHFAAKASPRSAATDKEVSPYYRDYAPNATMSQDGSKNGTAIAEASLADYPGSDAKKRFSFETAAQATSNAYVYAALTWGFTLDDPAKGSVSNEHATVSAFPSSTLRAAVGAFNKFYKNPGTAGAP